jgi:hypothetical protein
LASFTALTCPLCGGELENGFVIPGRGLAWSPMDARFALPADATWLSKPRRLSYANFSARRCKPCGLILFRGGSQGQPPTS